MSIVRVKMSRIDRAKQFAPFAALKGQDESLQEYRELREPQIELAEDEAILINDILSNLKKGDSVMVTYYADGCYTILAGIIDKIYEYESAFQINNQRINFEDIYRIQKRVV